MTDSELLAHILYNNDMDAATIRELIAEHLEK